MIRAGEIDHAAGYITETVARKSGDLQIEKHHAALGTIVSIQCAPEAHEFNTPGLECVYAWLVSCLCRVQKN